MIDGGTITINGGTVNVTGGDSAAAIGGGYMGNGGIITINGGNITAQARYRGIGIGTVKHGSDYGRSTITINGGMVSTAEIDSGKAELTLGWTDETDSVTTNLFIGTVTIKDGQMMTDGTDYYSGTLTNDQRVALRGKTLSPVLTAHTVTIGTVTGGSVTADKNIVRAGETVTVTTGTGYRIVSAKFNDSDITITDGAGTFTMPDANVTVTATVEKIPHSITCTVTGGTLTADKETAGIDDTVTLTATPEGTNTLYSLKAEYTDSNNTKHSLTITGGNNTYTFTMPAYDVSVSASFSDGLGYTNDNGDGQTVKTWAWLSEGSTSLSGGWYSAQNDLTISERITVTGDVKIILVDGVTLTIPKGITVEGDNKLTVYGQVLGTGTLTINGPDSGCAGIGGGGNDKAGGFITINGGKVTATSNSGYGIGAGVSFVEQLEAKITLGWTHEDDFIDSLSYNGTVTFSKNFLLDGTTTIAAPGNINGVKIVPCTSTVYTVTFDSNGGSEVTVQKIVDGQTATDPAKPMKQGNKFAGWCRDEGLAEAYDFTSAVTGNITLYAKWETPEAISYINANGETVDNFTNYTPIENSYTNLTAGFWYVSGNVTVNDRITVNGEVSIILGHGATLTASRGISVTGGNTLNVFADSSGTGRLIAAGKGSAAIGNDYWGWNEGTTTGTINIYGGQVTATQSDQNGKAIGASYEATSTGTITLGYTHAEDFIKADSYGGAVTVVEGKTFLTDDETPSEISETVDVTAIDGKKLTPKGVMTLTLHASITNGYVTAYGEKFFAGDTVTLMVTPNPGYEVKSVKYGTENATKNDDGTYSFVMPELGAEVNVEFSAIEYTISYELDGGTATNPTIYTVETATFTLNNPTKNGYTFTGWTGEGLDGAIITVTIPKGSMGNREYTAHWASPFSPEADDTPEFAYHSLILSGQIGVIFCVYAPEGLASKDFCVYFDVSGDKSQNTQPVYAFETMTEDGKNFLGFKCYINSIQMADKIHAELHYKDTNASEQTITHDYTANQYLSYIIDDTTQSADTRELGRAIMDFGSYVQPVLSKENGWVIGENHAAMTPANNYNDTDFTATDTATQKYAITNTLTNSSGIDDVKFALMLDSETTIILCLIPKSDYTGEVSAYVDSNKTDNMAVKYGNNYTVSIGNISAHELGKTHTVEITTQNPNSESDSFTVKMSALSYVQGAIHNDDTDLKRAVTSLYRYYDATMTYRNNRPDTYGSE